MKKHYICQDDNEADLTIGKIYKGEEVSETSIVIFNNDLKEEQCYSKLRFKEFTGNCKTCAKNIKGDGSHRLCRPIGQLITDLCTGDYFYDVCQWPHMYVKKGE